MQNLSRVQLQLVEELIGAVTGFSPHEENYKLCRKFSISNVRFNRYLDTDSFKVNRRIDGLIEKFNIHSDTGRAKELRSLVDEFLVTPLHDEGYPSTQSHMDILFFLLEMNETPLRTSFEEQQHLQINTNALEMDSKEDWHALLMDDIGDLVREDYNDSDSNSEREEDGNVMEDHPDINLSNVVLEIPREVEYVHKEVSHKVELLLKDSMIQPEYWQSNDTEVKITNNRANAIRIDWGSYLSRVDHETFLESQRQLMSEFQVLREVLWMLQGAEDSFLFQRQFNPLLATKNCYQISHSIAVPHLTNGALDECLHQYLRWGSMLQCIESVCRYIRSLNSKGTPISKTISTFAGQLSCFQHVFYDVVQKVEERVRKQETHTLLSVYTQLQPWFWRLSTVRDIILGATAGRFEAFTWDSTVINLINHIYDAQCSLAITQSDLWMFTWIKNLFVRTFEPYLHSMDVILSGQTCYVWDDLFLTKKSDIDPKDPNYWNEAYSLKYTDRGKLLSGLPLLLHPFVGKLIVTVKSVDLLKDIAAECRLPDVVKNVIVEPGSFIERIELELLPFNDDCNVTKISRIRAPSSVVPPFHMGKYPLNDMDDKLYLNVFHSLFASMHQPKLPSINSTDINQCQDSSINSSRSVLQVKIATALDELISQRHESITSKLMSVLLDDDKLQLRRTMSTLRAVYLMEAGDTMYDFTWDIFQRMKNREDWCDLLVLNLHLRECLVEKFDGEAKKFWISMDSTPGETDVDLFCLDAFLKINLNYAVSWPLYFVITEDCLAKYNRVFQFLLQVKYVKFCLDQLSFTSSDEDNTWTARCYILRHKMLHIVNSLHQFNMTRIHSILLCFLSNLHSCQDLCDLSTVHSRFIGSVHRACLLETSASQLKQAVANLLSMGLGVARIWRKPEPSALHAAEEKLRQYVDFLTGLFTEAVKRESLAHLEPLAEAFRSIPMTK